MRNSLFGENMEFFNGTKWKKISDYEKGEKVLIYDINNNEALLSTPVKYIKNKCKGINMFIYRNNIYNMELSDEAVFVGEAREYDTIRRFTLKDSYEGNFSRFSHTLLYNTFKYNGGSCMLTKNKLQVMIYSLLIGNISNNICTIETKNKKDYTKLLKDAKIKYKVEKIKNVHIFEYKIPRDKDFFLSNPLKFTIDEIYTIVDIVNSIPRKTKYIESDDNDILDFFQMIFTLYGDKSRIKDGKLYISKIPTTKLKQEEINIEFKKTPYQYSFTTKTGFIILRNNGTIFVFGDYKK